MGGINTVNGFDWEDDYCNAAPGIGGWMFCDCPSCKAEKGRAVESESESEKEDVDSKIFYREAKPWGRMLLDFYKENGFLTERQQEVLASVLGVTYEELKRKVKVNIKSEFNNI